MTNTPTRDVRVPQPLWDAAKIKAQTEHTNVSALIRQWLTNYTDE